MTKKTEIDLNEPMEPSDNPLGEPTKAHKRLYQLWLRGQQKKQEAYVRARKARYRASGKKYRKNTSAGRPK